MLLEPGEYRYGFKVKPVSQALPSSFKFEKSEVKIQVSYTITARLVGRLRGQYCSLLETVIPINVT